MLVRAERHALHAGSVGRFLRRSGRSGATAVQRDCLRHGTLQTAYRECGSLLRCVRFVRCLGSMAYTVSPVPRKSSSARFRSSLACAINPAACRMRSAVGSPEPPSLPSDRRGLADSPAVRAGVSPPPEADGPFRGVRRIGDIAAVPVHGGQLGGGDWSQISPFPGKPNGSGEGLRSAATQKAPSRIRPSWWNSELGGPDGPGPVPTLADWVQRRLGNVHNGCGTSGSAVDGWAPRSPSVAEPWSGEEPDASMTRTKLPLPACPQCRSSGTQHVAIVPADRDRKVAEFLILKCGNCHIQFVVTTDRS